MITNNFFIFKVSLSNYFFISAFNIKILIASQLFLLNLKSRGHKIF